MLLKHLNIRIESCKLNVSFTYILNIFTSEDSKRFKVIAIYKVSLLQKKRVFFSYEKSFYLKITYPIRFPSALFVSFQLLEVA